MKLCYSSECRATVIWEVSCSVSAELAAAVRAEWKQWLSLLDVRSESHQPPSPTPSKIPQKSSLELNPEQRRHFNLQPKNPTFACLHNSLWVLNNNSKHSYQVTISQLPQWYRYFTIESKIETISSTSLTLMLLGSGTIVSFLLWDHSLVEVTPH